MAAHASSHRAHPDWIPGTVHLVDLEHTMHSRHAAGDKTDIILVPQPSNDPDDPLNWSRNRKLVFLGTLNVYILAVGIASAAIYSVIVPISAVTDLTVGDLNTGTGYMFLAFGWGCLVWQPLAQRFGKRPVYLISLLGTMGIMLWAPYATTNSQWIANKVIQGFLGAPIESLCEISVSDVYFTHERGTYLGVYALALVGSNFIAPVMAGFINDGQGWQWVLYWCAIFLGGAFVIDFFFMEETNFIRKPLISTEPEEVATPAESSDGKAHPEKSNGGTEGAISPGSIDSEANDSSSAPRPKKTYLQKLKIYESGHNATTAQLKGMIIRPFTLFAFPIVTFSGFMYGAVVCYFNVLNGTASLILASPPYNFSSSMVGLSYVATLVGVAIGSVYSGQMGDKFLVWMTRRNKGIMEPEQRLWLYVGLLIVAPSGLLVWGLSAAYSAHWFGLVFAMGMLGFAITTGCQLPIAYCIDSYKDLSSDAMVTVIIIRNTMSFAVSYGITPWVTNMGFQNAFIVAAVACFAQTSLFFVFIKWGRKMRQKSAKRYIQYIEEEEALHDQALRGQ